jgi:hypothetical protein
LIPIYLRFILILPSQLPASLLRGLFPAGLPVKILKALLPYFILAACSAYHNLLYLITLTLLGEDTNYEVPHCEASSTAHSHPNTINLQSQNAIARKQVLCQLQRLKLQNKIVYKNVNLKILSNL